MTAERVGCGGPGLAGNMLQISRTYRITAFQQCAANKQDVLYMTVCSILNMLQWSNVFVTYKLVFPVDRRSPWELVCQSNLRETRGTGPPQRRSPAGDHSSGTVLRRGLTKL